MRRSMRRWRGSALRTDNGRVSGNHDFDAPERLVHRLERAGVTVLRDTVETMSVWGQPLEIAGLDYVFGDRERSAWYTQLMRVWPSHTATPRNS